jgi:beta-galactosidase
MTIKQTTVSAFLSVLALFPMLTATAAVQFPHAFAPQEGVVKAPEKPYRQELCLNGQWQFQPVAVPVDFRPKAGRPPQLAMPQDGGWDRTPIHIPSPFRTDDWPVMVAVPR